MSEIQAIIDDLKKIHDGDAWHGPSLKAILSGVTADLFDLSMVGVIHTSETSQHPLVIRRHAGK